MVVRDLPPNPLELQLKLSAMSSASPRRSGKGGGRRPLSAIARRASSVGRPVDATPRNCSLSRGGA
eukprot:12039784-Alexandrium_andersonii.AAC.1